MIDELEFLLHLGLCMMRALLESMKGHPFVRVLFAIVYLTSALFACFIQLILYVLVKSWNPRLYRKLNYYLAYFTHCHISFLIEWWANCEYDLFTDPDWVNKYIGKEHAFTIVNHGSDVEGILNWSVADHFGVLGNYRAFLKSALKYVPIYGLNWILEEQVFLQRNWETDKRQLGTQLGNLMEYPDTMWLCILPEGTRLSLEKLEASKKVAREKGFPELENVLLPRTKGFVATVNYFRGRVPAVYDFTIVVCKNSEHNASFAGLFNGKKICYKMMLNRYALNELPEDEKELANWLHKRYQEKDRLVGNVLSTGEFEPETNSASTEEMKNLHKNFQYIQIPKTKSSLWTIICSAVIILGWLFVYMLVILMRGDFLHLGMIIAAMITASVGLEKGIDMSISSKASSYGKN